MRMLNRIVARGAITLVLASLSLPVQATSLDQAVAQVRQQTGGRVLSAETVNSVHQIRVLTDSGKVRLIRVPAEGGQRPGGRDR